MKSLFSYAIKFYSFRSFDDIIDKNLQISNETSNCLQLWSRLFFIVFTATFSLNETWNLFIKTFVLSCRKFEMNYRRFTCRKYSKLKIVQRQTLHAWFTDTSIMQSVSYERWFDFRKLKTSIQFLKISWKWNIENLWMFRTRVIMTTVSFMWHTSSQTSIRIKKIAVKKLRLYEKLTERCFIIAQNIIFMFDATKFVQQMKIISTDDNDDNIRF